MIAIIDYGLGNINAFANIFKKLNLSYKIARKTVDLDESSKIVLPGVGAFDQAIIKLKESGMRERLDELVLKESAPVIGVCVGMQILAHSSEEGSLPGLGWINGVVRRFDTQNMRQKTHLPHMGWNDVKPLKKTGLFKDVDASPLFYFLHSYYFHCNSAEDVLAVSDYGGEFISAVNYGNIYGVQFHPEKSHQNGIKLLKNFADL